MMKKDKEIKKEDFKKDAKSDKGFLNPSKKVFEEKQKEFHIIYSENQVGPDELKEIYTFEDLKYILIHEDSFLKKIQKLNIGESITSGDSLRVERVS